jgi:class 3 adenylate cyclase
VSVRAVAYLATDVEGSRRLLADDPDAMRAALARHDALLRATVAGEGGRVGADLGDGLLATFDHPAAAVAAAVHGQAALRAADSGVPPTLVVRMAVHTGEAASPAGRGPGAAARQCLRLLAIGHGGQILLSAAAAEAVHAQRPLGAHAQPLGRHRLRDFARRERVFQVVHPMLPSAFPPLKSRWRDRWRRYAAGRALPGWRWLRRQRVRFRTQPQTHPFSDAPLGGPST